MREYERLAKEALTPSGAGLRSSATRFQSATRRVMDVEAVAIRPESEAMGALAAPQAGQQLAHRRSFSCFSPFKE